MMNFLAPLLALAATYLFGNLAKIPMRARPFVAIAAGILLQLFAKGGYHDGVQVQDLVAGLLVGLEAVGLYSGTKNVVQLTKGQPT